MDGERARRKQAGHERAARARAELSAAQAGGCCDAVATLASLLTTAAALAQTSGVNLVVAHPLQLDGPALGSSSDVGPTPGDEEGGGGGVALLPRPVRPLLVGIAAGALCRIVGQVGGVEWCLTTGCGWLVAHRPLRHRPLHCTHYPPLFTLLHSLFIAWQPDHSHQWPLLLTLLTPVCVVRLTHA